ncbi:ABC-3 protein [Denitrovibrio acetiphilus DSM 12809]|uniref:ABC-3 protein n=1 Tax=Denitrovibrio acetiphilus (strain DSM 12809 / NBRC 114555 / N2460) TaxID=522772 RepID=D4H2B6_DENA2|nr:iron chelate uptake ABC transporter family permease subunit [Denitrovibrio acetiphilus]ADD68907.1 ABC-3 protein [Denitrovibrio acetiphilus DSM 12809]
MDIFFTSLIEPLTKMYFLKALIGGSIVAVVCAVAGCLVILQRMAFLGDALSHAMIAGVGAGYLFMKVFFGIEAAAGAMLVGSLIAAMITVFMIGFVAKVSRIKEDTSIGIMYTGIFAAGVVLVSVFSKYIHIDIVHFIMGDILGISDTDMIVSSIVSATVLSVIILFFRYFKLTSFDPVMAASIGVPVLFFKYLFTGCVSLIVVSAVSMVGVILVVGLLITPAATAYLLTDRLEKMMALAALFGFTSILGGLYLSLWMNSAGGGAIMLFATVQFLAVLIFAPRYGMLADMLRSRRAVPQQLTEDIIGSVFKSNGEITLQSLTGYVEAGKKQFKNALNRLTADGLIINKGETISLTEKGKAEALRLKKAHRVWETYLHHMGVPSDQLHEQAHVLEHYNDADAIQYIYEQMGSPVTDPHGAVIPDIYADGSFCLTQMFGFSGNKVVVVTIDTDKGIKPGDIVKVSQDDEGFVVEKDGQTIELTQKEAASLTVKLPDNL